MFTQGSLKVHSRFTTVAREREAKEAARLMADLEAKAMFTQ
jgi:hypothetical protein